MPWQETQFFRMMLRSGPSGNGTCGRVALDSVCTECHELDRVYETRATLERWRVLLLEMRARGAHMPDDHDLERMAEYLSRVQSANRFE